MIMPLPCLPFRDYFLKKLLRDDAHNNPECLDYLLEDDSEDALSAQDREFLREERTR